MTTSPEVLVETDETASCTWALPRDATGARRARSLLVTLLGTQGVPAETIGDAELMVSELATNAYRHALDHEPHELWLDLAGSRAFVCAVFDALPPGELTPDPLACGDFGRGLSIVNELARGRWGMRAAASRLRPGVQGKAVWFACGSGGHATTAEWTGRLLTRC